MRTKLKKTLIQIIVILLYSTVLIALETNPFDLSELENETEEEETGQEYIIFYLNYSNTKELEKVIKEIEPTHFLIFDHSKNRILIPQNSEQEFYVKTIESLDTQPKQLTIEVKVVEINYSNLTAYQSLFSKIGEGFYISYDSQKNKITPTNLIESTFINLEKKGQAKILAKPKMMSKNNTKTILNIGEKHPYIELTYHEQSVFKTVKYIESGIKLNFKPRITNDGSIDLKIEADITHIKILKEIDTSQLPVLSNRHIESSVVIKNNHTVALAGMFEERTNQNKGGVPILKSIPILGNLFRYKINQKERSDIIILITPKIINKTEKIIQGPKISDAKRANIRTTQSK
jgi:type II secretory pathway component GspD/PulD (secretin)